MGRKSYPTREQDVQQIVCRMKERLEVLRDITSGGHLVTITKGDDVIQRQLALLLQDIKHLQGPEI